MSMHPTDTLPDKQTLSQMMDGEWQDIDRSACVAGLCRDAELKASWARWHLVRDALRGEPVAPAPSGLAARIRAAVGEEPAYSNVATWPGGAEARTAASIAPAAPAPIATSVAATSASPGHGGARVSGSGSPGSRWPPAPRSSRSSG